METALTTKNADNFKSFLERPNIKSMIAKTLPKFLNPENFFRSIFLSAHKNPKIYECSPESIIASILQCAELGLMPVLGRAYLIPYWNGKKKRNECQFQPGYQGLMDLARRSKEIKDISAHIIYTNDRYKIDYMNPEKSYHEPRFNGDKGEPVGAYALWFKKDGSKTIAFMTMDEIYKRREKSVSWQAGQKDSSKQDSPWYQWPDEQTKKTVIKNSSKMQPCSIDMQIAIEYDNNAETGEAPMINFDTPETEKAKKRLTFEEQIPDGIDQALLNDYLQLCAENTDMTIESIKESAAANINYFLKALEIYKKKIDREKRGNKKTKSRKKTDTEEEIKDASTPALTLTASLLSQKMIFALNLGQIKKCFL